MSERSERIHHRAIVGRHLQAHVLNELQYRTNFFLQLLQSASQVAGALVAIALIYGRVDELNGWTQPQLLAAIGVYTFLGGVMRAFVQPAMMRLMDDVQSGTFDFALTKPADAELLVSVRAVDIWQTLDLVIGAIIVGVALAQLSGTIGVGDALAFAGLLIAGAAIIYCVWLSIAAAAFWFVRIDFVDALYVGLFRAAQYPIGIYPAWLRVSLTIVIPLGIAVTAPSEAITSRLDASTLLVAVAVAVLSLLLSRVVWRHGVRRYSGASS
jgi:ABC-2 type transport system permease protein